MKSLFLYRLKQVGKFSRLSTGSKLLLVEISVCLFVARLLLLAVPFKRIVPLLTGKGRNTPPTRQALQRLKQALAIVSDRTPWQSTCLTRAVAAKLLLRRHGFSSTLFLGLARTDSKLTAHAWLSCNDVLITGASHTHFKVISSF